MTEALARRRPRFIYLSNGEADERFGWRLVAANNRPMGRAIHADVSLDACRGAATRLHRNAAEAARTPLVEVARGHWSWRVGIDGVPVAISVHRYLRRVECLRALDQFIAALAIADPADGVVRCFGPNSLRSYDPIDEPSSDAAVRS